MNTAPAIKIEMGMQDVLSIGDAGRLLWLPTPDVNDVTANANILTQWIQMSLSPLQVIILLS